MKARITNAMLENAVSELNTVAGTPTRTWVHNDATGHNDSQDRNYCVYSAYGAYGLHQVNGIRGGVDTIFGLTTKRELYHQINAMITGIRTTK